MNRTLQPLDAFSSEGWERLASAQSQPMLHPIWLRAAAEVFAGGRAEILTVGSLEAPEALAAFYEPESTPGQLRLLGAIDLGESVDLLAADDAALAALAQKIWQLGRPVDLGHLPTDTALLQHLRAHRPRGALLVARPRPENALPWLALDAAWADPLQAIGRKRRQSLMRKRRLAESQFGPLRTRILAPDARAAGPLIEQVFEVEARSWKSRAGTALTQQHDQAAFFRLYGQRAADQGLLRLAVLEIGGAPAAVQYGIETETAFWSLKIGFDERFASVSPGKLLMFDVIQYCVAQGLTRLELAGKEADWTRYWTSSARPIAAVRLYPPNWSGLKGLTRDAAALALRQTRSQWAHLRGTR